MFVQQLFETIVHILNKLGKMCIEILQTFSEKTPPITTIWFMLMDNKTKCPVSWEIRKKRFYFKLVFTVVVVSCWHTIHYRIPTILHFLSLSHYFSFNLYISKWITLEFLINRSHFRFYWEKKTFFDSFLMGKTWKKNLNNRSNCH